MSYLRRIILCLLIFTISLPIPFLSSLEIPPRIFTCLFDYGQCLKAFTDQKKFYEHCESHYYKQLSLGQKTSTKPISQTSPKIKMYICLRIDRKKIGQQNPQCLTSFLNHSEYKKHVKTHMEGDFEDEFPLLKSPFLSEDFNHTDGLLDELFPEFTFSENQSIGSLSPTSSLMRFIFSPIEPQPSNSKSLSDDSLSNNLEDIIHCKLPLNPIPEFTPDEEEIIINRVFFDQAIRLAQNYYFKSTRSNYEKTLWIVGNESEEEEEEEESRPPSSASTIIDEEPVPPLFTYLNSKNILCYLCTYIYSDEQVFLNHLMLHPLQKDTKNQDLFVLPNDNE